MCLRKTFNANRRCINLFTLKLLLKNNGFWLFLVAFLVVSDSYSNQHEYPVVLHKEEVNWTNKTQSRFTGTSTVGMKPYGTVQYPIWLQVLLSYSTVLKSRKLTPWVHYTSWSFGTVDSNSRLLWITIFIYFLKKQGVLSISQAWRAQ